MEQENIGPISFEDKEKMDPNLNKNIFSRYGMTNTINPPYEFQNNQKISSQINNGVKENHINKSSNQRNEENINNNKEKNKNNENVNRINNINESNTYYGNELNYNCNSNVNYKNQNFQNDNNELNNCESNNIKHEKNIKVQEIIVGNRKMERYDGAEYNNPNVYKQNEAQFSNNQFLFHEHVNINAFNNSEYNCIPNNAYNEHIQQSPIYNNINEIQLQEQFNTQFHNNSPYPLNNEYINNNYNYQHNHIYQNDLKNTQMSQQMNPEYFEMGNREKVVEAMPQQYNQKNISVEVLYPKPGYGNSEEIQNKLKKKKKIKYVRRLRPLIEQHFDVHIIQTQEEVEIPSIYPPYLVQQNQYRYNIPVDQPNYAPFPQKAIHHLPKKYKIKKYKNKKYDTYQKSKISQQDFCNSHESQSNYYSTEDMERNKIYYNCTCRPSPRQTIINITPMKTINRWNTNNDMERQFKTEGYKSYRHMAPSKYMNNGNTNFTLERYVYSSGEPNRKYTNLFFKKNIDRKNLFRLYNENEEMSNSNFVDVKRMRIRNNY